MRLTCEITRDPDLLGQYYRIREASFRRDLGLPDFDGSEDERDRSSHILVARYGGRCIGGTRISGRHPGQTLPLPMEEQGLDLHASFPQLRLWENAYCQWSRYVVDPEFRTTAVLRQFSNAGIDASRALGYVCNFVVAGMARARLYKRLYSILGYRCEILPGIRIPPEPGFQGLPHLLSVAFLDPDFEELFWARPDTPAFGYCLAMPGATA